MRAIFTAMVVCCALPGAAATTPAVNVTELARCAAIVGRDERLDCYDAALAGLVQPQAATSHRPLKPPEPSGTVTQQAASVPQPPAADKSSFGLPPPPQRLATEGTDQIKALVDKVIEDRLGNISLVLDNGQAWTFIEPGAYVRPGQTVTIKRAALGSYLLTTSARRSYHIRRDQ